MTEDNQVENVVTETTEPTNSLDSNENKGFSQEEVNRIVADRVARERKKFDGIDIEQYKNWQNQEEERKVEQKGEHNDL